MTLFTLCLWGEEGMYLPDLIYNAQPTGRTIPNYLESAGNILLHRQFHIICTTSINARVSWNMSALVCNPPAENPHCMSIASPHLSRALSFFSSQNTGASAEVFHQHGPFIQRRSLSCNWNFHWDEGDDGCKCANWRLAVHWWCKTTRGHKKVQSVKCCQLLRCASRAAPLGRTRPAGCGVPSSPFGKKQTNVCASAATVQIQPANLCWDGCAIIIKRLVSAAWFASV